ncbi:hypothetical protein V6N13_107113 [Hibiscus sabdariffa]
MLNVLSSLVDSVGRSVIWLSSPDGWIKANSNGVRHKETGLAFCRGVICDSNGGWLGGFAKFIGLCSVIDAYIGLLEAWDIGLRDGLPGGDKAY